MPFEATHAECLTGTVYGDTFKSVVVDELRFCGLIGVGIGLPFAGCACARDYSRIDDLELTVSGCASFDVEACTVHLRFGYPFDSDWPIRFFTRRAEFGEFHRQRGTCAIPRRAVIAVVPIVGIVLYYIPETFLGGKFPPSAAVPS